LGPIRKMLAARAADAGLPTDQAQDLILAVGEAMANNVEHGARVGVLRGWLDDQLTIEVHDAGTLVDDYWGLLPPPLTALRGRGLLAIAAHREGIGFAIGAKRIAALWRTLAGVQETDWVEAIDMPGA
jgi:anti-sigma regulatory factor (Ser/Thr protein kinase)